MNDDLRQAKAIFDEFGDLLNRIEPLFTKMQVHTAAGEQPPNELMAEINDEYVKAIQTIKKLVGDEANNDPTLNRTLEIQQRMAAAYKSGDVTEIAICNAENIANSFNSLKAMVGGMQAMFAAMTGEMPGGEDDGPTLWTPDGPTF